MIRPYENKFIRTLRNITKDLDNGLRCKHAAMLTDNGKIISIGVNKSKSDPIQKKHSCSHKITNIFVEYSWTHAEIDCLKGLKMDFKHATLYVIRTDSNGHLAESCPCKGCQSLINKLYIPRIVHSTADGGITEIIN